MELDALKFTVETTALDDAITKVGTLQLAVKKLGSETVAPKVIKADNIVSKDAEERVTKLNNVLERQQDILAFMASGFSKGQASVLAFGKTAGLATDQLKLLGDVLDTQRKLIGGDTFDKSNSALKALQNQYALLKDAARAYNEESSLTQKQLQGLGLDKERLLEKYKIEGKSLSSIKAGLRELNTEYNKAAISVNQQVAANTKLAESSRKTAAGQELANKAMAKADEMLARLQNRTKEMSKESPVSATAANQLYAYEKALKAAGVGADDATARLAVFRAEQQKVSQLSRAEETLRMQHLSRALAPQVTDVTVGLMTGQNPFTVFLQQGGQIRDQIGLSQVAVENLGKVFKDTFVMMGAMVVAMGKAIYAFFATPVGAAVLALSALALGIYKVGEGMLEAETRALEINKALILFGNTAGLTVESLKGLSKEASSMEGISLSKSTEAMIAFSKAGEMTSDEFVKASQSAVMFEKYAGVAISDTAKAYKELSKDPLKAVSKLNEETGFFTATIIKQIAEYERLGDKEAAAALSRKTYTDATMQAALDIKDSLSGLGLFMDSVGNIATEMWKKIKGLSVQAPLKEQRDALVQELSILGQAEAASKGQGKRTNVLMVDPAIKQKMQELELLQGKIDKADNRAAEQQRNTASGKDMSEYQSMINANKLKTESKQQKIDRINIISAGDIAIAAGKGAEEAKAAIEMRDKLIRDIETGKGGPKKAKSESTEAFSINLSNELQQYEKQYGIEIKLQDDFIRQEKARLDNALAAKEITQGEFNARDLAASERGYTDRQALSDKYYSGIIQANEKNISEMVQQYQAWVNQEGGTPKFFEQNEKAVETLRSKIINTNNETSVFLEKIQASAASAKENAFTRYSKQLSILQGEIRGVTLAYDEYLQSEANLTKQKQAQVALEDKVRFATPEQAIAIRAAADETERLTKQVQDYDKQIRASKMSLDASVDIYLEQVSLTGEVTEQTQTLLNKEIERYDLLVKTKGLIESTVSTKVADAASAATTKYQKDQMKALSDSVAGAIEIGLYEGGDAGSKALRKIVEAELRKPITLFIQAVVGSITGAATSSLTGGSSVGDKLGSLGQAFNGAGLGSFAASQMGQNMGLSSMPANGMGPPSLTGAGEVFSSLPIGGMLTAYQVGGAKGFAMGAASTAIAGAISGMAGATGALAGATAALGAIPGYGWAAMAALSVLGAGGGFTSASSTGYSNKSFSNTGTASDISTTTTGAGNIVDALYSGYAKKAESLGISKAAARFSFSSNTGREGQNPNFTLQASAGGRDYITQTDNPGLFGSNEIAMSDANMQLQANRAILTALQGSEMPKYLKGAFDSLVVGSMDAAAVNATFEAADALKLFHDQLQLLPFEPLKDLSYTATEALKAFSGGLDKFSANLGTYYDKFYTEQEKADLLTKNTKKAFEDLGLVLPDINDQLRTNYRAIVEELSAKDLSISANAAAYTGALQLAGAVDQLAPAFDSAAKAIQDNAEKVRAILNENASLYFNNIDRVANSKKLTTEASAGIDKFLGTASKAIEGVFDKQISGIKEVAAAASTAVSAWSSIASTVKGVLDGIYKQTATLLNKSFSDLYTEFTYLNLKAKGGDVASASKLSDIATAALTASENQSLTLAQYLTERARIASGLEDTLETANDNISIQQSILDASNSSVTELQSINTTLSGFAADVYELLSKGYVGADKSTANIAVDKLVQMTTDSAKFFQDYKEGQTFQGNGFSATRLSGGLGQMNFEGGGSTFISQSESILEAAKRSPELRALWEKTYGITLPSFDIGSNYVPYDMTANIHEGERIIPKADNLELMNFISNPQSTQDNSGIISELRNLRQELNEIKTLQKVNNSDTKKTADTLINVTLGGEAMQTQTIP